MLDPQALWVVIPVHNRRAMTEKCLESLETQTVDGFHVVVVDDGSTDGTSEAVQARFPDVHIITGDGSWWWSGATNTGACFALQNGAQAVLTLNDDTLAAPDMIEAMLITAAREPRSLFCAIGVEPVSERVLYGGTLIDWPRSRYTSAVDKSLPRDPSSLIHSDVLPGRGLFVPAAAFVEVGFFAARLFPQAVADYDFAHRASRAGFKLYCDSSARLYTFPEETGGSKFVRDRSLGNYWLHLTSRKGAGNLGYFVRYGVRNCPRRYVVPFLVTGVARRLGGYLADWAAESLRPRGAAGR